MSLTETITADVKSAMLAHESTKVSVLRLLQSELKNALIKKSEPLTDEEIIQTIKKEVKKRQEAAELYTTQGYPDRATAEMNEVAILSTYLPAAADPAVVESFVKERLASAGEPTPALRGVLIKETMAHFGNQVDGRTVSEIVARLLS
jgi:uncharacterized protein YqeY